MELWYIVDFYSGKQSDTLEYFKDKFEEKLKRMDECEVRDEFKLWMFQNYFLPSVRFILTVHELTPSSLKVLDSLSNIYLKKWAGLPNCTTMKVVHSSASLNISIISDLYLLCHALEVTNCRMKADSVVNLALDSTIEREGANKKTSAITIEAQKLFEEAAQMVASSPSLPPPSPSFASPAPLPVFKVRKKP